MQPQVFDVPYNNWSALEVAVKAISSQLIPGMWVGFEGQLGAGKTTLVQAILRHYGYQGFVKSPTYALVESYDLSGFRVHHFDLYRLMDPEELYFIGLEQYSGDHDLCFVEWPDRGKGILPLLDASINLSVLQNGSRRLTLTKRQTPIEW